MDQHIRPMESRDRNSVLEMMREFYASPAVFSNGSEEIFSTDIDNCVGDNPYVEGYIFEARGEIQGYGMIAKSYSTEFGKTCIWIEDLYIKSAHRGKGLGEKFLTYIAEKYKNCLLRLEVEEENAPAVGLYKKFGFTVLPYVEMKK